MKHCVHEMVALRDLEIYPLYERFKALHSELQKRQNFAIKLEGILIDHVQTPPGHLQMDKFYLIDPEHLYSSD